MRLELIDGEDLFVIHGLLLPDECEQLVARFEASGFEAAAVLGERLPQLRNNSRAIIEDAVLAADLWRRAAPFVHAKRDGWLPTGLHERFRFYRYETAEYFAVHRDGYTRRGEAEESLLTFMVYLSDVEQGGSTIFHATNDARRFEVQPGIGARVRAPVLARRGTGRAGPEVRPTHRRHVLAPAARSTGMKPCLPFSSSATSMVSPCQLQTRCAAEATRCLHAALTILASLLAAGAALLR